MISLVFTENISNYSKHMLILEFLSPLTIFIAELLLVFLTDVILFSDKYSYQ